MKELVLDGAGWTTKDDLYDAFFRIVGAPQWHRRNFDAVNDSIATGSINEVEGSIQAGAQELGEEVTDDFVDLIHKIAGRGCPVEIRPETRFN